MNKDINILFLQFYILLNKTIIMNKKNIAIFLILLLSVIGLIVGVFSTELDEFHIENPKDSPISIKDDNNTFTISIKHKEPEIDIINILKQWK